MRLEKASHKAIKYACMNFHYAKAIPVNTFGYSVFNDENEFCGVILFGTGASPYLGKMFNLNQGQVVELVRVALNGKQGVTSKPIGIAIKIIRQKTPLCKLIISYADLDQNHIGTIYQALNFYYLGVPELGSQRFFIVNGKKTHPKSLQGKGVEQSLNGAKILDKNAEEIKSKGKRKYIYPLDKSLIPLCKSLAKPYPKNAAKVLPVAQQATSQQEGFDSTLPLNKQGNISE